MATKDERRAARDVVASYHEARLRDLVEHVGTAVDLFRDGKCDAFDVDQVIFQYSRAAKELWKFCNLGNIEITARFIRDEPPTDWWERGEPRRGRQGDRTTDED